ncbi:MAG: isocitrate/isopropylmalate dehydrogenase family protein [Methanobrevibacter sp.]|jgi:methanogen homoisocitrate dehydrogenase|nr:isocitrate/isopropylmalate dehydrogenase family protein [Candidatus Methanovirga meridionalis]
MYKITTIGGDGIGPEVMEGTIAILEMLGLNFDFIEMEAGKKCLKKNGTTIPEETIKSAKKSHATLFGAITTVDNEKSPIIVLRKSLDVYGNLRPVKSFEGIDCLYHNLDFHIVRENTEGLYCEIEYYCEDEKTAISHRVITKKASEKIIDFTFKHATENKREKVTCIHKANVLKKTDGLFKEIFYKIAKNYPNIKTEDYQVNEMAMHLIQKPEDFDYIVTTNLFGDILSDEAAGLVGGLGLAPSGNIGDKHGLFEPVHGSAPDIAGRNISNPIAMILSSAMMLDFLNEKYYANQIRIAVENVLKKKKIATPDLGGCDKTMDVANAIINKLKNIV